MLIDSRKWKQLFLKYILAIKISLSAFHYLCVGNSFKHSYYCTKFIEEFRAISELYIVSRIFFKGHHKKLARQFTQPFN